MFLAYMDECGNTGNHPDPDQPIHFLGCLVVEDIRVRAFEQGVAEVAKKYFPDSAAHPRFEFHGVDMFGGTGFFKTSPQIRIDAAMDLIALATEHAATFGYVGVDKIKSYANDHPHRICFTLMMEHLEGWLGRRDALALLVSDENHEVEQDIIKDIDTFKKSSTRWGYRRVTIEHVIDSVHFVKSHNNPLIQVADLITYITLKAIMLKRDKMPDFRKRSDKRQTWPEWAEANYSRPELATRKLWSALNLVPFSNKIWPT